MKLKQKSILLEAVNTGLITLLSGDWIITDLLAAPLNLSDKGLKDRLLFLVCFPVLFFLKSSFENERLDQCRPPSLQVQFSGRNIPLTCWFLSNACGRENPDTLLEFGPRRRAAPGLKHL